MSTPLTVDAIVRWIDGYTVNILAAPPMWGCPEAVEMQVLQLAEVRAVVLGGSAPAVFELYQAFLVRRFPRRVRRPLFELVAPDDAEYTQLAAGLRAFVDSLTEAGAGA